MADKRKKPPDAFDAAIDPEMLARAEQAVAALSGDFSMAIQNDAGELRDLIERLAMAPDDAAILNRVFDIAHDLHGQGGSFGFPLISRVGAALCRFIDASGDAAGPVGVDALRSFADAAAALVAQNVTGEGDAVSRAMVENLETLADLATRPADRRI